MRRLVRLAVIADIHANLPALNAVLEAIRPLRVRALIAAGDLVGYGPSPNEVIQLLRSRKAIMIRGNTDTYPVRIAAGSIAPDVWTSQQWAVTRWTYEQMQQQSLNFLATLPEQRVVRLPAIPPIRVVHGSPFGVSDSLDPDQHSERLERVIASLQEPVMISGHTHKPWMLERDARLLINPGSVSGSANQDWRSHYAILTWDGNRWSADMKQVAYDLNRVQADFRESGFLEQAGILARLALLNIETGHDTRGDFVRYAYQLASERGYPNCSIVPDAIWDEAARNFSPEPPGEDTVEARLERRAS